MTQAPPVTLYDRLGGTAGIASVVERFYELALLDPLLRPCFAGADLAALRQQQTLFLAAVTGGHVRAAPPPDAGLDADAFDRLTYYLSVALHEHHVASRDSDEVLLAVRRRRAA